MSTNASATWTATSTASAIAPSQPCVAVSVREARNAGRIPTASVTPMMRTSRKRDHAGVERDLAETRKHGRRDVEKRREHERHEGGADRAAAEREQKAFGEHHARTDLP